MFRALVCSSSGCSSSFPHPGRIACCPAPDRRPPATKALHTICGNNTSIVSSSWWWAYKCPKHVEQIISAIKHSVTSSWFYSLRLHFSNLFVTRITHRYFRSDVKRNAISIPSFSVFSAITTQTSWSVSSTHIHRQNYLILSQYYITHILNPIFVIAKLSSRSFHFSHITLFKFQSDMGLEKKGV